MDNTTTMISTCRGSVGGRRGQSHGQHENDDEHLHSREREGRGGGEGSFRLLGKSEREKGEGVRVRGKPHSSGCNSPASLT